MDKVLVTGANGFVGRVLCQYLLEQGFDVVAGIRDKHTDWQPDQRIQCVVVGDINLETDWRRALKGVSVVVHLAARVHVMKNNVADSNALYRQVNVQGTENLANQAYNAGVKRFIYLSSIKVNGEQTQTKPFTADDVIAGLTDAYAVSKFQAEQVLFQLAAETGLDVVIIRPPLVYGERVKGNFLRLIKWVNKGVSLPFAKINNQRSLVNVRNLCDFICVCIGHEQARGHVFLVADGMDLATPQLIELIAKYQNKNSAVFAVPLWLLNMLGQLLGKQAELDRLCGSLQLCLDKNKQLLGWTPSYTVDEGIEESVRYYLRNRE